MANATDTNEDIDLNKPNSKQSNDGIMDDNEVAALLASLKHKIPPKNTTNSNSKTAKQTTKPPQKQTSKDENKTQNNNETQTESKSQTETPIESKNTNDKSSNNKSLNNNENKNKNKTETETETKIETKTKSKNDRKRTFSEMANDTNKSKAIEKLSDPRSKRSKTIIKKLKSQSDKSQLKKTEKLEKSQENAINSTNNINNGNKNVMNGTKNNTNTTEPFSDIDWNNRKFLFIRLTYFNKRKCRKFPLFISSYSILKSFIEYYFPSLHNCKWHIECDENWIESLEDYNSIRDEHMSNACDLFLELMLVNESLPIKSVYAPKPVYLDNPYKCSYPPIEPHEHTPNKSQVQPPVQPPVQPQPQVQLQPQPQPHVPVNPPPNPYSNHHAPPQPQPQPQPPPYNPYINTYQPHPSHAHTMYPPQQPYPMHTMQPNIAIPDPATAQAAAAVGVNAAVAAAAAMSGGYHHVEYPHYLNASNSKGSSNGRDRRDNNSNHRKSSNNGRDRRDNNSNQSRRASITASGAICPDPTTYLPFAHAGQSTPQMRTLHKIVWVLQHQKKPLTIDAIRSCLPGKKKAQINEIDYLLSSYESYNYTKSMMVNGRKVWQLCPAAFPPEFWNMQWQRTN